jgi:hypothetical protein
MEGGDRILKRNQSSAWEVDACDMNKKEEIVATTAEILGIKMEEVVLDTKWEGKRTRRRPMPRT